MTSMFAMSFPARKHDVVILVAVPPKVSWPRGG
jgi:hypothetical protein